MNRRDEINFKPLTHDNYHIWEFRIANFLRRRGLWIGVIEGITPIHEGGNEIANQQDGNQNPEADDDNEEEENGVENPEAIGQANLEANAQAVPEIGGYGQYNQLSTAQKQEVCLSFITDAIDDSQIVYIRNCSTGREAWKILKKIHRRNTPGSHVELINELTSMKLKFGGDVRIHINEMVKVFDLIAECDTPVDEKMKISFLLRSLHNEYSQLIVSLEAIGGRKSFSDVQALIINEYFRREKIRKCKEDAGMVTSSNSKAGGSKSMLYSKQGGRENMANAKIAHYDHSFSDSSDEEVEVSVKSEIHQVQKEKKSYNSDWTSGDGHSCHRCGKSGHFRSQCPNKKSLNKDLKKYPRCFILIPSDTELRHGWVIDSGSTMHICNDKSFFFQLNMKRKGSISVANGNSVKIHGKGSVRLTLKRGNSKHTVEIHDVAYAPDVKENLLSVREIVRLGYNIEFSEDKCYISNNNEYKNIIGRFTDGQYYLTLAGKSYSVRNTVEDRKLCIHQWHKKLAHRNLNDIKRLKMEIKPCNCSNVCEDCIKGKMAARPYPKKAEEVKAVMDCVVSDVCGPLPTESLGRKQGFVTFIDVHSGYSHVSFIRKKSEVSDEAINYIQQMKTQTGKYPKIFRSDRGTEYLNKKFVDFLNSKGIIHQCTAGYASPQNGIAERKNRTLMDAERTMLSAAGLPKKYWAEAIHHANHVQNCLPARGKSMSPFQIVFNRRPFYDDIHEWGSEVYAKIPDEKRKKLDLKAVKVRFMGVDDRSKGYRVADSTHSIKITREIRFLEEKHWRNRKPKQHTHPSVEEEEFNFFWDKDDDDYVPHFQPATQTTPIMGEESKNESLIRNEEENQLNEEENSQSEESFQDALDRVEEEAAMEPVVRRSNRTTAGVLPGYLQDYQLYQATGSMIEEPKSLKQALASPYSRDWTEAMEAELTSIIDNNTWTLVELPKGRRAIGSKWVYKVKHDSNGEVAKFKARLVAQGFTQRYGTDYDETFAPVARSVTFRILLNIAGNRNWNVSNYDIKTAFLNGKLEEEIYLKQPPGFEQGSKVCKLNKSLYGLKQAAKVWNQTLHEALTKIGFNQNSTDNCLYVWKQHGDIVYILVHVDDMLVTGSSDSVTAKLMLAVGECFEITNLGGVTHYLGIDVARDNNGKFEISQSRYIDKIIEETGLTNAKPAKYPLNTGHFKMESPELHDNHEYRKLIGMLLYLTTNTRPDIAATVSILSKRVEKPREHDLVGVKQLVRYLIGTKYHKLKLGSDKPLRNEETTNLMVYSDANWAEDREDRKSTSGFAIKLFGGTISWSSKKQDIVALSSAESEYVALTEACKELIWIKEVLRGFDVFENTPTTTLTDSQSVIALMTNQRFSHRSKHIDLRYHFLKHQVEEGNITLKYVPTEENVADILTKPLGFIKTQYLRKLLGVEDNIQPVNK